MKRSADNDEVDDGDEARDQDEDDSRDHGGARKRRRPECEVRLLIANKVKKEKKWKKLRSFLMKFRVLLLKILFMKF